MFSSRTIYHFMTVMGLCLFIPILCSAQTSPSANNVLATVNGTPIPIIELKWEIGQLEAEMRLRNRPLTHQQIQKLRPMLITNLIERELLYQQAQQTNIRIRPQWINAALSDLKEQLGGNAALNAYLSGVGMSYSQLKERLHKGLAVRRLLRKEAIHTIKVSEAEIQAFYREHAQFFQRGEQVRVRHILVSVSNMNDELQRNQAWQKIQSLQNRLQNGENFAVLALEYSNCPSRIRGGDLGYLDREQMLPRFADAAYALQPGKVSDVITTRFGYHLIQMLDRRPPSTVNYKEARSKIERTIRRNKENKAVQNYVAQLKNQVTISHAGTIQ